MWTTYLVSKGLLYESINIRMAMIAVLGVCFLNEVSLKVIWSLLGNAGDLFWPWRQTSLLIWNKSTMGASQFFRLFRTQKCQIIGTFNFFLFYILIVCKIPQSSSAPTDEDLILSWHACWPVGIAAGISLHFSCADWKLMVNIRHVLLPNNSQHEKPPTDFVTKRLLLLIFIVIGPHGIPDAVRGSE